MVLSTGFVPVAANADMHYVWADSADNSYPYTSWQTAADTLQVAIDAAAPEDTVLVRGAPERP